MPNHHSKDDIKRKYLESIPDPLGRQFFELFNQVAWLHLKWGYYRQLYADKETADLLSEAASSFFSHLQGILWNDILLHLCRVSDPPKTGNKGNLSVCMLTSFFESTHAKASIKNDIDLQVQDVIKKTKFARDWRNRSIAHNDLHLKMGTSPEPLAHASRQSIEEALASVRKAMNIIQLHFLDEEVGYEYTILSADGVDLLLSRLRIGVDTLNTERQNWPTL